MRVVLYLGGELVQDFCFFVRGVSIYFEGCSEVYMYLLLSFYTSLLYTGLVTTFIDIYCTYTFIYMMMYVVLHLSLHVLFIFYFYTHVSLCT